MQLWPPRTLSRFEGLISDAAARCSGSRGHLTGLLVSDFLGEYAAAESCFLRALDIREKSLGEDHLLVAGVLNNYASLRRAMGDYAGARLDYERALRIREQNLPPEHPLLASSLNNLGYLLWVSGDYAAAKPIYVRALDINEKANGPNHPSTALALGNLANLLRSMSEYAEARPLYERALRIEEAALGPSHRELAATLTAMADLHISMRNLAAALPLYERALRIQEKALGLDHPEVAITLCRLADALQANGAGPQVRLYERALAIQDKALGPRHPIEATTLNSLARLLAEVGRTDEAFEAALRAEAIGMEHLHLTARTLAEREALRYESVRASGLGLALDLVVSGEVTSPAARERAWDALIRSRAIVLDEIASRHRAVEGSSDAEIARLASSLTQARTRLANLTVRGPESLVSDVYRELLDQARAERDRAERDLAVKSLWVRQEMERERIGLAEVTKSLSDGTTLVSFALYQSRSRPKRSLASRSAARAASTSAIPERTESEDVPYYLAFVLSARQSLTVIALGPAGEIDALVSQWSKQCGLHSHPRDASRTLADYRRAGEALRHAVWDPLESTLRGAQRILVVPDGALHLVNLAALPLGDSHYLIETAPLIHYLSTERDLTRIAEQKAAGHGLLAVGGPDFEASGSSALAHGRPSQGSPAPQKDVAGRGIDTPCKDLRAPFPQLPASRREVKEIESLWSRAQGPRQDASGRRGPDALAADVVCLTDADATETAFKTLAPGRRVLHVATHGFFLGGPCLAPVSDSRGLGPPRPVGPNGITPTEISSPLLLSGLVFAGANHRDRATSNEDDAILTAEEIASLDLRDVEWVVLSACDTGVGEVRAGESVFGLRRAFQIAGARTLIMSLWSVQDEAARQWMESLYQGRFLQKLSTADAVRRASIEVLRQRRAEGQSTHPFSWAGFIAVGNWD